MRPRRALLSAQAASRVNVVADLAVLLWAGALAAGVPGPLFAFAPARLWCAGIGITVWLVTALALRHYKPLAYNRDTSDDASLVIVLAFAVATILALSNLVGRHPAGSAPTVRPLLLIALPLALLVRLVLRAITERQTPATDVLIVGTGPIGRLTGQDLTLQRRQRVLGYLNFSNETAQDEALLRRGMAPTQLDLLGPVSELQTILRRTAVSEVYIAGNARKHDHEMQGCIKTCEELGVPFALPASGFRLERARPMDQHAVGDGYLHYLSVESRPGQLAIKRLFDIAASAFALWLLLPPLLIVAALVKLTSRGPIFFKQVRMGLHARPFHMLKFRSMVVNADALKAKLAAQNEQAGPVFKMKHDPRVTAIGRFIRKYSIDELPQLINVLRGDMSLVGPRPPVPDEVVKYEAWQLRRLSVRPGLTCIWQVSGRNQISFEQWMYLDLQYIDHWSLAQDFSLLFKTVPVVITGRGAS